MAKYKHTGIIKFAIQALTSIVLLVLLVRAVPLESVYGILRTCRVDVILLAFLFGALSIMINALRWRVLLKFLGYQYKFGILVSYSFIALFFNVCIPGGVAGDILRSALFPEDRPDNLNKSLHISKITASVFADKLTGLSGLMLLAATGIVFSLSLVRYSFIVPAAVITALIIFLASVVLFSARAHRLAIGLIGRFMFLEPFKVFAGNVFGSLRVYRARPFVFLKALPFAVASHLCVVIYFYILAQAIGIDLSAWKMLFFVPLIEFVAALPISVGGLGVREATTVLLFSSQHISSAKSVSLSLLAFIVVILTASIGAVMVLCNNIAAERIARKG